VGRKNLDAFDAVAFFTDGDLDMDDSQKADLLSFVHDEGKGFIGIHSAAITFTSWPEYGKMLGGYYDGHPWGEFQAPLVVEDPNFPGMTRLSQNFTLHDEIYQIKDFSRANVRVLLRLDADKVDLSRQGVHRQDKDFAVIWAREYGKGRVLYNGLGHSEEVWGRPDIQKMWVDMVRWSMGDLPGDAAPRPARQDNLLECAPYCPGLIGPSAIGNEIKLDPGIPEGIQDNQGKREAQPRNESWAKACVLKGRPDVSH
jgi:type 1 glutamine amidotransferase